MPNRKSSPPGSDWRPYHRLRAVPQSSTFRLSPETARHAAPLPQDRPYRADNRNMRQSHNFRPGTPAPEQPQTSHGLIIRPRQPSFAPAQWMPRDNQSQKILTQDKSVPSESSKHHVRSRCRPRAPLDAALPPLHPALVSSSSSGLPDNSVGRTVPYPQTAPFHARAIQSLCLSEKPR